MELKDIKAKKTESIDLVDMVHDVCADIMHLIEITELSKKQIFEVLQSEVDRLEKKYK